MITADNLKETLSVYEKAEREHSALAQQHANLSQQHAQKALVAAGAIEAVKNLIAMEEAANKPAPQEPEGSPPQ